MSQENVEVVRLAQEAWNRGDVEASIGFYADDAEVETDPRFIDGGTFRGLPAIRRWGEGLRSSWERGGSVVISEFIDLRDDRVLSLGEWSGTGEASGVQISIPLAGVWTLKAEKVTRVQWFFDHQEALEAVGLRE
jgi:ketosteroid isomerase-like protein